MTIEQVDRLIDEHLPNMHGWCTPEKAKRMARLVIEAARQLAGSPASLHCVELGVFGGRGIVALGLPIRHCIGVGAVDGIDPYTANAALEGTNSKENDTWWSKLDYGTIERHARENVSKLGLDTFVRIIKARSQDIVARYADGSISVLHQDSNHSEEVSCSEVAAWTSKMRPGGYWVFDDTNWETTKLAQSRLVAQHGFTRLEEHHSWAVFQAPL